MNIQSRLFELQDLKYKDFHVKLVPGVDPDKVIGVRIPVMRKLAKELSKVDGIGAYLDMLPHDYIDENTLHGLLISEMKDYDECLCAVDAFLPYVDNWATCDLMSPKAFKAKKNHDRLLVDIRRWIDSDAPYTTRFGLEMLMSHFLDDEFKPEYLDWAASATSDHYYVRMMVAWYFATALAKQYEATAPYLETNRLAPWTHNKTIQKAIESFRVSDEHKAYLRTLKVK